LKQKDASKDSFRVSGSEFSHASNILFALEENAIHHRSKPEDPSNEPNPDLFESPKGNTRRHHRKEEEAPHLHTGDNKSKA
jgi:hypothetical protein